MSLLEVSGLGVTFGATPVVEDVSLSVAPGQVLGIVGESGSGKSMTVLAIMGLLPHGARQTGTVTFGGRDLTALREREMVRVRGREIGMVFQEPMTALNPVMTIGAQLAEAVLIHERVSRAQAWARAGAALERVGLSATRVPHDRYPHELSGGQRQRVGIAIATVMKPKLLIADEPTTALDVTTQAQILALLRDLVVEDGMGLILVSHDLAVVAGMADDLAIMRAGQIVERGQVGAVFAQPQHAYTRALMASAEHVPVRSEPATGGDAAPVLAVDEVRRRYPLRRGVVPGRQRWFEAVRGVSFSIQPGESVGLVGESGSGKSTLARAILGLEGPDAGTIRVAGHPVDGARGTAIAARQAMQMVFQDPYGSFDPRQRVERLVAEPFHLLGSAAPTGAARRRAVDAALEAVGLAGRDADKFIHEFSGGQRQRIAIARALVIRPRLVVLDEPVSALDVTIRAQVLDLLADLQARFGLSYLLIAHDLALVRAVTDRVLVMKDGAIVESGPTAAVFSAPQHAYTRALIAASPRLADVLDRRAASG